MIVARQPCRTDITLERSCYNLEQISASDPTIGPLLLQRVPYLSHFRFQNPSSIKLTASQLLARSICFFALVRCSITMLSSATNGYLLGGDSFYITPGILAPDILLFIHCHQASLLSALCTQHSAPPFRRAHHHNPQVARYTLAQPNP